MSLAPVINIASAPKVSLRAGRAEDAAECGEICFNAFKSISEKHNFPPDFPAAEPAIGLMAALFANPDVRSTVAEVDGRVVGSNFLWKYMPVAGIGPITVDPKVQNGTIGRQLMQDVLEHARETRFPSVRLVQAGYHMRSLSLYSKLGFVVREPLVTIQGQPLNVTLPGHRVRAATRNDLSACTRLCSKVHGHARRQELRDAVRHGTATVVERAGRIAGYTTVIGFFGHAVAETNDDLKALIGAASEFTGPGFLLPSRNTEVFTWCLEQGLRVMQPMTLMSMGLYNKPAGAFLPSILY